MPQFGVYKNPGRNQDILFVVQIQSTRLDRGVGRVVMPLVRRFDGAPPDHSLSPHMMVQGQAVFANPFDITTVPTARLKDVLEILSEPDQDRVIRAIDDLISRA